jgi:hypothetical protein
LIISMADGKKLSLEEIRAMVAASEPVEFEGKGLEEMYGWMTRLLRRQGYSEEGKVGRGLLRRYMEKMTGRSRAQVTRLIARYVAHSEVKPVSQRRHRFAGRFTRADIELLAEVDEAHERLSGPATKKILEREWEVYKQAKYERLSTISPAHIYNLRRHSRYRERYMKYTGTRAAQVAIGERRKPTPEGKPGYIRIDTVHQGDLDGVKGVYHINAVDEVTQWQVVGAVAAISQAFLGPVLQAILCQFPFTIQGFHSDNGSEFINESVAALLKRMLIAQTKSRPRNSNDNGLVECKNGAVIRKHMGFGYIAQAHAGDIDEFYQRSFNPYLNFHRPCGQPERITDARGKDKFVYRHYATPFQTLCKLERAAPPANSYLKPEFTIASLAKIERTHSDTASAQLMQQAKCKLFVGFAHQERKSA